MKVLPCTAKDGQIVLEPVHTGRSQHTNQSALQSSGRFVFSDPRTDRQMQAGAHRGKCAQVIRGALAPVRISRDLRAIVIAHRSRKALQS